MSDIIFVMLNIAVVGAIVATAARLIIKSLEKESVSKVMMYRRSTVL